MPIVPAIITQHAEMVCHLWGIRAYASGAPNYTLAEFAHVDDRLEAHLDGLVIAGSEGWGFCKEEVGWNLPGDLFGAAWVAFSDPAHQEQRLAEVVAAIAGKPGLVDGLISALARLPWAKCEPIARCLLEEASPVLRRAGLAAFVWHRRDPGKQLEAALKDSDVELRTCALKAIGELPNIALASVRLDSFFDLENPQERFAAAWTQARLHGKARAIAVLQECAVNLDPELPERAEALQMAVRKLAPASGKTWQRELAQNPATLREACVAAGALGDPELMPWIFAQMDNPEVSRAAGEAFSMITGVDLAYDDLECDGPEGFEAGPNDDPADDNVALDADEDLPWPAPSLIASWWQKNQSRFKSGSRYLCGEEITPQSLNQVLRNGTQRQRAAAALELAIREPSKPLFNTADYAPRQSQILGQ